MSSYAGKRHAANFGIKGHPEGVSTGEDAPKLRLCLSTLSQAVGVSDLRFLASGDDYAGYTNRNNDR